MAFDYSQLDDTALAQQLHNLAQQIAAAKGAKDVAQVKALWAEFQRAATEYTSRDQAGLSTFINQVHDGVVGFLQDAAATAGNVTAGLIKPLLVPLLAIALLALIGYWFYSRAKRAAG